MNPKIKKAADSLRESMLHIGETSPVEHKFYDTDSEATGRVSLDFSSGTVLGEVFVEPEGDSFEFQIKSPEAARETFERALNKFLESQ